MEFFFLIIVDKLALTNDLMLDQGGRRPGYGHWTWLRLLWPEEYPPVCLWCWENALQFFTVREGSLFCCFSENDRKANNEGKYKQPYWFFPRVIKKLHTHFIFLSIFLPFLCCTSWLRSSTRKDKQYVFCGQRPASRLTHRTWAIQGVSTVGPEKEMGNRVVCRR